MTGSAADYPIMDISVVREAQGVDPRGKTPPPLWVSEGMTVGSRRGGDAIGDLVLEFVGCGTGFLVGNNVHVSRVPRSFTPVRSCFRGE